MKGKNRQGHHKWIKEIGNFPEATNATDIHHQEQPLIEAWSPSLNLNQLIRTDGDLEPFCEDETSSIGDFPDDLFTRKFDCCA